MTFPSWVAKISDTTVERAEGRRPGGQEYLRLNAETRRVIWHTTEGSSVDGAVSTLRGNFSAPHFVVGEGRIVQMRPLWAEAATVRGDNSCAWQVECVAFSKADLWLPSAGTLSPIVELLRYFRDQLNIPLARPVGWRDDCVDIDGTWATESNSRRRSGRAPSFIGHVMHLEWPENTHWDQGAIQWTKLFTLVREDGQEPGDMSAEMLAGSQLFRDKKPLPSDASAQLRYGYNLEARIAKAREIAEAAAAQAEIAKSLPPPSTTTGITQAQADARYAPKQHPHVVPDVDV